MRLDTMLVSVTFRYPRDRAPQGRRVSVVGSFNGWDPAAHPLERTPRGDWATTVFLPPGRVVYGFWVDGAIRPDPLGEGRLASTRGSEYSVRYVRPERTTSGA